MTGFSHMPHRRRPALRFSILARRLALAGLLASSWGAPAQTPMPAAVARWQASMDAFSAADRQHQPPPDGLLLVGSSSIRLWAHLPQDLQVGPVLINRGFGGSTMADCHLLVQQLVVQYRPRQVIVYAGENDLAEGRTPAQVLESFQGFVRAVRAELPHVRLAYVSIKPSPARAQLMPQVREANALLQAYVQTLPQADFIDVFTPMLGAHGEPRAELFGPDRLHMSAQGYALWRSVIAPYVQPAAPAAPSAPGAPLMAAAPLAAPASLEGAAGARTATAVAPLQAGR